MAKMFKAKQESSNVMFQVQKAKDISDFQNQRLQVQQKAMLQHKAASTQSTKDANVVQSGQKQLLQE